jgi:IS605 OrfB family transposase
MSENLTNIKTRKIQLIPISDFNEAYQYIREISSELTTLSNEIVRRHLLSFYEMDKMSSKNPEVKLTIKEKNDRMKEKYSTSVQNLGYQISKEYSEKIPSDIRTCANQKIYKTLTKFYYDIINAKISVPSFKKDKMPIPFSYNNNISLKEDIYEFKFFNDVKFKLNFGRDRSNNKIIVDRILSGEYKAITSQIQIKKNKIFLFLSYKFEPIKIKLNSDLVLGIDVGINRPVSIARNDGKYVPQINIGSKIEITRAAIRSQRNSLTGALRHSSNGRGRNKKMKKQIHLIDKEKNFMKTMNNTISRKLIQYCISEGIGSINMENLSGITRDTNSVFLKSWAYYSLQSMIEYKAKEYGIKVQYIDPAYTSQTCSSCGNLDKEQRAGVKFVCKNESCLDFNIEKDADVNAAQNISRKEGEESRKLATKKKLQKKLEVKN